MGGAEESRGPRPRSGQCGRVTVRPGTRVCACRVKSGNDNNDNVTISCFGGPSCLCTRSHTHAGTAGPVSFVTLIFLSHKHVSGLSPRQRDSISRTDATSLPGTDQAQRRQPGGTAQVGAARRGGRWGGGDTPGLGVAAGAWHRGCRGLPGAPGRWLALTSHPAPAGTLRPPALRPRAPLGAAGRGQGVCQGRPGDPGAQAGLVVKQRRSLPFLALTRCPAASDPGCASAGRQRSIRGCLGCPFV